MTAQELQDIVLRSASEISDIRGQMSALTAKEKRVETSLQHLRARLENCLATFDRDRYKSTDQRLLIEALAVEILIFERLGYDVGASESQFILGIATLLQGRNQAALDYFRNFLRMSNSSDHNVRNAAYLAAMVCYNRRDFSQALELYEAAFRYSPETSPDWQSKIYVGELLYFLRRPQEQIEKPFRDVEEGLSDLDETTQTRFVRATLYLKLGNCYADTLLDSKERNLMVKNAKAIEYYKKASKACPPLGPESLLRVVIDYSLAQALISANSIDMDLQQTPSKLLADVFRRLRRIVLTKREEIILAQSYFMLGTCAVYSRHVSSDAGEIYLEYARHQTLTVPSDVCFYSCITKELLSRDDFIWQIDHYANELERKTLRR